MKRALLLASLLTISVFTPSLHAQSPEITGTGDAARGVVSVKIGGKVFTELHYQKFAKPVLYPVIGPTGANLLRQWPVVAEAAPGEEKDHPHHKGIWFTHGAVNGIDFWKEADDAGTITVTGKPEISVIDPGTVTVRTNEAWKAPGGKTVCTSETVITCGLDGSDRYIDYAITITASEGEVTFGDTKEGTMGLRSHPALNLKGKVAAGHAVNSEGERDDAIWGKNARWVDYYGPVDDKVTGFACFDHPANLRHPTTWHARDYGLVAANPFGLHDFQKKPKGAGDHVLKKGESLTLKYRWLFHTGDAATAKIGERWKRWAGR